MLRMKKRKEFIFKNVLPFHMIWTIFIIIPSLAFYGALYYFLWQDNFNFAFVILFVLLYFGTCYLTLKAVAVEVTLWFDDHYLYIKKGNRRFEKYSKADITGLYAHDYETETPELKSSKIYFTFSLKNKKSIHLYDVEYKNQFEEEKGSQLKEFLKEVQSELKFSKRERKNNYQNIYWYSSDQL